MLCNLTFDFGDVPTWVASVGTVGTLGAAVWGLAKERQARREDIEDRQASQARLVTSSATAGLLHGVTVSVTNHSAAPIHAVRVLGLRITRRRACAGRRVGHAQPWRYRQMLGRLLHQTWRPLLARGRPGQYRGGY